jgi:hypothetical protein
MMFAEIIFVKGGILRLCYMLRVHPVGGTWMGGHVALVEW